MTAAARRVAVVTEWRTGVAFAAAAFVGSAATVDKYGGHAATIAYLALLLAVAPFLRRLVGVAATLVPRSVATALAIATFAGLVVLIFAVYPHANTHAAGAGSDRDDAADLGAHALLTGRYPYAAHTYLGNPISQFPGGLVFGAPFELARHTAYAAFFWLPALFALLVWLGGNVPRALVAIWLALALSPVLVRELVTGGDLFANTVAVAAGVVIVAGATKTWARVAGALMLGVALSWRLSFLFVLPPLVALLVQKLGTRAALATVAATSASFAAITLPFYLPHADHFPPFAASNKLSGYNGVIPGGADVLLVAGFALSAALAVRSRKLETVGVLVQTAAVEAFFVVAVVVLASVRSRSLDLEPLVPGYGLPVLVLALPLLAVTA